MKSRLLYIEHKTAQNHQGEAWIGEATFSKSGQTIYFNNQAFKKITGGGVKGNYYDLETGDEYWISGVKKNGQDRHRAGGGKIKIDARIIDAYLSIVDVEILEESKYEIVPILPTDTSRFNLLENAM